MTERKQLDDHVQQLERLASLGRFGASIAHEIRNPLTGVSLFLDNLHDRLARSAGCCESGCAKALEEIERAGKTNSRNTGLYTSIPPVN
ncbi:MAG: histidine kinase dimerization/phospho-acceptor domain-containing protein [Calditrichia bacterium]